MKISHKWGLLALTLSTTFAVQAANVPRIITDGELFDLEGQYPHPMVKNDTLVFVPLTAQVTTSGGGGWRHEYKIKPSQRISIYDTYEQFSATYKMELSKGAKTIIAQIHGSTISTLMKVYVADSNESGFIDSKASNGIFDVYTRLRGTDGKEIKVALGTIKSGDSFDVNIINDHGTVTVSAMGRSAMLKVKDNEKSYFKFGNYIQSQDPSTLRNCGNRGDSASWEKCFKKLGITESKATLTNITYSSNHLK